MHSKSFLTSKLRLNATYVLDRAAPVSDEPDDTDLMMAMCQRRRLGVFDAYQPPLPSIERK